MEGSNFILIFGWMVNDLKLKGNDLLIFATIYSFSRDGKSKFTGSLKYLESSCGSSRNTVIRTIKKLVDLGLILKHEEFVNDIKLCRYSYNNVKVNKIVKNGSEQDVTPSAKMRPPQCQNGTPPRS